MSRVAVYSLTVAVLFILAVRYSTQALSVERKQVVLVVEIDTGVNLDNEELQNSFWKNETEIPNNGKDDDGNGYIDDYIGFNAIDNRGSGFESAGSHGSTVCAIIEGLQLIDKQNV